MKNPADMSVDAINKRLDEIENEREELKEEARQLVAARNEKLEKENVVARERAHKRAVRAFDLLRREEAQTAKAGVAEIKGSTK